MDTGFRARVWPKYMIDARSRSGRLVRNHPDRVFRIELNNSLVCHLLKSHRVDSCALLTMTTHPGLEAQSRLLDSRWCDGSKLAYFVGSHGCVNATAMETAGFAGYGAFGHRSAEAGKCSPPSLKYQ